VDFADVRNALLDPILHLEILQEKASDQTWTPQSSGIKKIKQKAAGKLIRLWAELPAVRTDTDSTEVRPIKAADTAEPLNLILYGPPGTGKTYRLQQTYMPRYADKDGERFEFITFHQSYSYEDFVEGIRPVTIDGSISYEVRHGVLRRLCERARDDPGRRYALFIDEINRGNIAKIFGELITLVEGDKRLRFDSDGEKTKGLEVTLPYSGHRFGVPANVDLIATMNTADRSIALLDTALRRRFRFEELMPNALYIDSLGSGIIPDGEGDEIDLRQLLDAMNARLTNFLHRDQTLGHAYFTRVRTFSDLRSVMAREILPLLQEYFYDDWRQIRLVLADQTVNDREYQLVRQITVKPEDLFPSADTAELGESHSFEAMPEAEITPDAIRKIYEPR
jgi:5-methylcytosine-specific restriction enzyme B